MGFFKLSSEIFATIVSILSFAAVVLLVIGLVGNGFEMRKIRQSVVRDKELISKSFFLNKSNWKGMP